MWINIPYSIDPMGYIYIYLCIKAGLSRFTVIVTTIFSFFVEDPYEPSFANNTGKGDSNI